MEIPKQDIPSVQMSEKDISFEELQTCGIQAVIRLPMSIVDVPISIKIYVCPKHDIFNPFVVWESPATLLPAGSEIQLLLKTEKASALISETKTELDFKTIHLISTRYDALYQFIFVFTDISGNKFAEIYLERFLLFKLYQSEYLRVLETKHLNPETLCYKDAKNFNLLGKFRGYQTTAFIQRKHSIKGKRLLDLGCATGGPSVAYHESGAQVVSFDIDPVFIELTSLRSREESASLSIVRGSGFTLPFRNDSFDIVVFADVYEHVPNAVDILKEIYRVMKKSAVLYISAPNRFSMNCIRREPHYGLPGLVLMPRPLAKFWITKIKKTSSSYELYKIPDYFYLLHQLRKLKFHVDESWGFEYITEDLIRRSWVRNLHSFFKSFHLQRLVINKYIARICLFLRLDNIHFLVNK